MMDDVGRALWHRLEQRLFWSLMLSHLVFQTGLMVSAAVGSHVGGLVCIVGLWVLTAVYVVYIVAVLTLRN